MKEMFAERKINYNLRVTNNVYAHKPRTTAYGLENISSLGQIFGKTLHLKESHSLKRFKNDVHFWIPSATVDYVKRIL